MENGFLTLKQAVQYLGLKGSNLYAKVERNEIPHYKFGRLVFFKKDDLDAWAVRRKVDCRETQKEARKISSTPNSPLDIDSVIKKAIEENSGSDIIPITGNQIKLSRASERR